MNSKKCKECNKILENTKNIFCDKSCAATHNNKIPKRKRKEKTCLNCGKIINKYANSFCNIHCYNEYGFKEKTLKKYYRGEINSNNTLRKILIYLFGEKCSICPCTNIWMEKPLTLQVDHIDGNSDNNLPNNLRLLCPNCHTQTSTYCGGGLSKETKRNKYLRNYKNPK